MPRPAEGNAAAPARLGVSASTDMALRLSRVLGRSAESWLAMQDSYDLWQDGGLLTCLG